MTDIDLTENPPELRLVWKSKPGDVKVKCETCNGHGDENFCHDGEWTGFDPNRWPCKSCNGTGKRDALVEVNVDVIKLCDSHSRKVAAFYKSNDGNGFTLEDGHLGANINSLCFHLENYRYDDSIQKTRVNGALVRIKDNLLSRYQNGEPVEGVKEITEESK